MISNKDNRPEESVSERRTSPARLETATLAMGCFWGPEALFGHMPGVIRTRTGYAGGTFADPTYRDMGDHSETVQMEYDPAILPFETIVEAFWANHNPDNINDYKGNQYKSLLFYGSEEQHDAVLRVLQKRKELGLGEPATEIRPYSSFHPAEERHQKYYLQRFPDAMEKLSSLYPDRAELFGSTLAARLNGVAKGYAGLERVLEEIRGWPIEPGERDGMLRLVKAIRW